MDGLPVIRLEVEYMKHAILHAFADHQVKVDAQLRVAVDKVCSPENLQRVLDAEVKATIEHAIKRELEHFFQFGDGKDVVKKAVRAALKRKA